jgi:hypothetical protein
MDDIVRLLKEGNADMADILEGREPGERIRLTLEVEVTENSESVFSSDVVEVLSAETVVDEPLADEGLLDDEEVPMADEGGLAVLIG